MLTNSCNAFSIGLKANAVTLSNKFLASRLSLCCCNCGHYSKTYEPLIDVILEIKDADSLHSVLESFTRVEKLDDQEIKYSYERYFVALQMHNVDTITKLSFSLPNHHASDVSESNVVTVDKSSSAPRPTGAINSSYFHELMKIVDNELKKTAQTFTPGPPSAINSSKENNASKDIGVIERMTPSRPQSTLGNLIFNFYLLMDPEQETEIIMACSMINKRVPGPRGEELMTALRRLGSRGSSLNEKNKKMEVSQSRKMEIHLFAFRELPRLPNKRNAAVSSSPLGTETLFLIIENACIISVSFSGSISH
ncbi:hypothetical protein FXO38_09416 [Capsicum annuum]|nr:hypothetical protein FXO38_09416 [Capsicum annuum]